MLQVAWVEFVRNCEVMNVANVSAMSLQWAPAEELQVLMLSCGLNSPDRGRQTDRPLQLQRCGCHFLASRHALPSQPAWIPACWRGRGRHREEAVMLPGLCQHQRLQVVCGRCRIGRAACRPCRLASSCCMRSGIPGTAISSHAPWVAAVA